MQDPYMIMIIALAGVTAVAIISMSALQGWKGWLALKQAELARATSDVTAMPSTSTRIEVADMKERIRKLEAIAAGVDL